jgi:hypothetical protein
VFVKESVRLAKSRFRELGYRWSRRAGLYEQLDQLMLIELLLFWVDGYRTGRGRKSMRLPTTARHATAQLR